MALTGILTNSDTLTKFATDMIQQFGTTGVWSYEKCTIINSHNPTEPDIRKTEYIPISIAITSWEEDSINDTVILQGDKQGIIAYAPELADLKVGDYIVRFKDGKRYRIVTPCMPQEYKDEIVGFIVNLRV